MWLTVCRTRFQVELIWMRSEPDAIPLRLTANQVSLIWSGLNEIVKSHSEWRNKKAPLFSYPFRFSPPPAGFNRGKYDRQFMQLVLGLWKRLRSRLRGGGRVRMNTIEIRAAILGARINMDLFRFRKVARRRLAREGRKVSDLEKRQRRLEDARQKILKKQTDHLVRNLERRMKRADYHFRKPLSRAAFDGFMKQWRAHVRFMRLHFAYFKALSVKPAGAKRLYQLILDELTALAIQGLQNEGYKLPDASKLRKIMRLFVAYARRKRIQFSVGHLLQNQRFAKYYLCEFIEARIDLVEH